MRFLLAIRVFPNTINKLGAPCSGFFRPWSSGRISSCRMHLYAWTDFCFTSSISLKKVTLRHRTILLSAWRTSELNGKLCTNTRVWFLSSFHIPFSFGHCVFSNIFYMVSYPHSSPDPTKRALLIYLWEITSKDYYSAMCRRESSLDCFLAVLSHLAQPKYYVRWMLMSAFFHSTFLFQTYNHSR